MKKSKTSLNIFSSLLLLLATLIFTGCETHGFTVKKISSTIPSDPRWNTSPPSSEERDQILKALDQPYYYIAKGDHCYAFKSADGKRVLKFFRQYHQGRHSWHNAIPLPNSMMAWYLDRHQRHLQRREIDYTGYKNAYEFLKDETGLRFLHLNRTNDIQKKVTLIYKDKLIAQIDIDRFEFLMQDYFDVGFKPIKELLDKGESQLALSYCRNLLELVMRRCQKGFADKDLQLYKNFGFKGGQAFEIDVGFLSREPAMAHSQNIHKEITHVSQEIANWLHENYPQYKSDFSQIVTDMLSSLESSNEN